ncbi:MAG: hypothetical protein ACI9XR_000986 [Flavobacterium sp.]|jgi:hypothetical protein
MKKSIYVFLLLICLVACSTQNQITTTSEEKSANIPNKISDTVRIANDKLEYEVIIYEPGFGAWLATRARPRNFYSESYLKGRNRIWVAEWNNRTLQPLRFDPNLYEMQINYEYQTDYGYEVNYMIYNYLIFFQQTYKQSLGGFVPRY